MKKFTLLLTLVSALFVVACTNQPTSQPTVGTSSDAAQAPAQHDYKGEMK